MIDDSDTPQREPAVWKEAKPPPRPPGPIYNFRRGYELSKSKRHETANDYAVFQQYMHIKGTRSFVELQRLTGKSLGYISRASRDFNWQKRAAEYDKRQLAIVYKRVDKLTENAHKQAIIEFRESSEKQARMMARVSEDILRVIGKRIAKAEEEDEEIPMQLVAGLLRSAANISEQSRQAWANALGVNEMLEMVEAEMDRVNVEDITEVDAYEIPLDE
jgi:hypothetical protein